jgi:hypothetical protein
MLDQFVQLLKGAFVEQKLNALASRQLAGGVLFLDTRGASAGFGALFALP